MGNATCGGTCRMGDDYFMRIQCGEAFSHSQVGKLMAWLVSVKGDMLGGTRCSL